MHSPERLEPINGYQRSAEYMFALLASTPDEAARFYAATWDRADPTALRELITMVPEPTGARKDERWGQFYSAQFQLTETSLAGEISRRFVWCYTGASNTGRPIDLDVAALAEDYGYKEPTETNIVADLTARAKSVDDHLTLVHLMRQHRARPTTKLTTQVNHLINRFMTEQIKGTPANSEILDPAKMFQLIGKFLTLDRWIKHSVNTSSYVATPILHALHGGDMSDPVGALESERASVLLETILTQNVLPNGYGKARILSSTIIYKYPFATEALYDYLEKGLEEGSPLNIFGIRRTAFAGEYIAAVLQQSSPVVSNQLRRAFDTAELHAPHKAHPRKLHDMIDRLVHIVNEDFPDPSSVMIPIESPLSRTGRGFAYALARLRGHRYKEDENLLNLDAKAVRVVEHVLAPLYRRVGELTLYVNRDPSQVTKEKNPLD